MKPLIVALLLLLAWPARAQTPADPADFQAAVDRELAGVAVDGRLDVTVNDDGTATVTYTRTDGQKIIRTVRLPERREDAIETVALLAGNLVRDQMSGFPAEPPPAPAPAPAAPAAPAAPPAAAPAPRVVPAELGFVPPLSTDLLYDGPVAHRFAFHMVAGSGLGMHGASVSGAVDVQRGRSHGVQLAGAASIATADLDGVQVSGAVSVATGRLRGVQVAGAVNVAGEASGAQIAPVNIAQRSRGLQLGVFNYSDSDEGIAIGVISIVRHGITELDATVESYGGTSLILRHGRRHFYTLYGAATTFAESGADSVQLGGLGFGGRILNGTFLGAPADLDLDLMGWTAWGDGIHESDANLDRARLTLGVRLGWITVFAGAAANVFIGNGADTGDPFHPQLDRMWQRDDVTVRLWPSVFAGIRIH